MVDLILAMAMEAMVEDMGMLSSMFRLYIQHTSLVQPGLALAMQCVSLICTACALSVCNVRIELQAVPHMHF